MDWKRIMNRGGRQVTEEEARQYLAGLRDELNLRLLADAETLAGMVLWVESVTVTAYMPGCTANALAGGRGKPRSLKK